MNKSEVNIKRQVLQKALNELPVVWCSTLKLCKPANETPPGEVVSNGCDDWVWDSIPF